MHQKYGKLAAGQTRIITPNTGDMFMLADPAEQTLSDTIRYHQIPSADQGHHKVTTRSHDEK